MLPDDRHLAIRVMAMPADTNSAGDIFGGWLMSQVDIAGSIAARRHAQGRVVTVAVNAFEFHEPVYVGDLVSCYARITRSGRTSLTVHVQAFAERQGKTHECIQVTEADLTYVAVDEERRPIHGHHPRRRLTRPIPTGPLQPAPARTAAGLFPTGRCVLIAAPAGTTTAPATTSH